jgi:translocation and assembly module TamB
MRRRVLRLLRRGVTATLALALVLGAAGWTLLGTGPGLAWTLRAGAAGAGIGLDFATLRGSLLDRVEIEGLSVRAAGTEAEVRRVVLDWSPRALLSPALEVETVLAQGVRLRLPQQAPAPGPPVVTVAPLPAIGLPLPVRIARLEILDLILDDGTPSPLLERLALRIDAQANRVGVAAIDVTRGDLVLGGDLGVTLDGDWPLDGAVTLAGQAEGMAVDLEVNVAGSARVPTLSLAVRRPARVHGSASADLRTQPPGATLDLDWEALALPAVAPLSSPRGRLRLHTRDLAVTVALEAGVEGAPGGLREVALHAEGRLDGLQAPLAGTLALEWRTVAAAGTFAGRGRLSGSAASVELDHELSRPFTVTTHGTVHPDGVATALDLSGEWRDAVWPPGAQGGPASPSGRYTLSGRVDALAADLEAALSAAGGVERVQLTLSGGAAPQPPHAFDATLAWQADTVPAGPLRGTAEIRGDRDGVRVDHRLQGPGPARARVAGTVALAAPGPLLDLAGEWTQLRWPLEGDPLAQSPRGRLAVAGPVDALAVRVDAEAQAEPVGPVTLQGTATLDPTAGARDLDVTVDVLQGRVTTRGQVSWAPAVRADLVLDGAGIDPGHFDPRARGRLAARVQAALGMVDGRPLGDVTLERLGGTVGGYPVEGSGRVRLTQQGVEAREVLLASGRNRLRVDGRLEQTLALDAELEAPALEQIWPELAGSLSGSASVGGSPTAPVVRARLDATGVGAWGTRIGAASLDADVDLAATRPTRVTLSATGLEAAGQSVERAEASLTGTPTQHRLLAQVQAPEGELALGLTGTLGDDAHWRGELRTLDLLRTPLGDWRLEGPAALAVAAGGADLEEACLSGDDARLCARASRGGDGVQSADLSLSSFALARLGPWLPEGLVVDGSVAARASARSDEGSPLRAQATATATPIRISLPETDDGDPLTLSLDDLRLGARHGPQGTEAELGARIGDDGRLTGRARIGPGDAAAAPLEGKLEASVPDLSPFAALVPAVTGLAGRLEADVTLGGSPGRPLARGRVALHDARADITPAGITVERTQLALDAGEDGRFTLAGEAHSGEGSLSLDGRGHLHRDDWSLALRAHGERFQAVKLVPVQAEVSPRLALDAGPRRITLRGEVQVTRGRVKIEKLPPDVVRVSDDEVIVGREPPVPPAWRRTLDARVDVALGEDLRVQAFGLEAGLSGGLTVSVEGVAPPTANGAVALEGGRFTAYGQDLSIRRGRLMFAGPLDNPGLDVEAVRVAGDVTAGITVSGTANDMRSQVFSEPPLPQAEALAYLLTGRGLSGANADEGTQLAGAAIALGLEQSDQVTRDIGDTLGLDQLSVAAGDELGETSLLMGKRLAPGLYIRYALGLFGEEGRIELGYEVTDNVTVEVESGTGHGADVIYRLER